MTLRFFVLIILMSACMLQSAHADDFSYTGIAERYSGTRLNSKIVQAAKMHGECLVGLKQLIFVKRTDFDPVAEWINYRTISLLEQFPPCNVLIMMQVARAELIKEAEQP